MTCRRNSEHETRRNTSKDMKDNQLSKVIFEATSFIILDDEEFRDFKTYDLTDHIVYTTYTDGLTEKKAQKAIRALLHSEI